LIGPYLLQSDGADKANQFGFVANRARQGSAIVAMYAVPAVRHLQGLPCLLLPESGEDSLYHKSLFVVVDLPKALTKKLIAIEKAA